MTEFSCGCRVLNTHKIIRQCLHLGISHDCIFRPQSSSGFFLILWHQLDSSQGLEYVTRKDLLVQSIFPFTSLLSNGNFFFKVVPICTPTIACSYFGWQLLVPALDFCETFKLCNCARCEIITSCGLNLHFFCC